MRRFKIPFLRRFLKDEQGQSAAMAIVTITTMIALAGASVETGHVYYAYRLLSASTNAATLAGAQVMPVALTTSTTQTTVANTVSLYSCASGGYNRTSIMQCQTPVTTLSCLTAVTNTFNVGCQTPPSGGSGYNALTVTDTAQVNLWFGGLVGFRSMNLSATGTAAMKGGTDIPYNLAIVIDTTSSMNNTITEKSGTCVNMPQIECAIQGFTTMLQYMDPCPLNADCTTSTTYVDDVALFVFPAISNTYKANSYNSDYCSTTATSVPYNFQNVTTGSQNLALATTGTNAGAYEIIPFTNNYKLNDSTKSLNTLAQLVKAVGYSGSGCHGLAAPGGQGTYYAQVIYGAQAALAAQKSLNPSSKNIMIVLSDGDATACNTQTTTGNNCSGSSQIVADNCPTITTANGTISSASPCVGSYSGQPLNGTNFSYTTGSGKNQVVHPINPAGYQSPAYPSALGQCGQAVQAAQAATAAGTTVYTVAFDSPTSGGCTTDQTYTITGLTNGAESWPNGSYPKQPCDAIGAMASNPSTFFSDNTSGCPAIAATNASYQSLAAIFQAIANGLTAPRLIPNGTK